MKIDVLSDVHLDFHFRADKAIKDKNIVSTFKDVLSMESEVLIIAGDITHYNSQIVIVERIAELFDYKKIFMVLGNHDLYLITRSIGAHYNWNSKNRQKDWYSYRDPKGIIEILNGNIVEYKGIKFGGAMSWYDGTYNAPQGYNYRDPVTLWKYYMNDANKISGYKDFYDIYKQERPKIEAILEADIIITHVCPIAHRSVMPERFRDETSSMFYAFDGEDLVAKSSCKYWVYGHQHQEGHFDILGKELVINPFGYPSECHLAELKTIEI